MSSTTSTRSRRKHHDGTKKASTASSTSPKPKSKPKTSAKSSKKPGKNALEDVDLDCGLYNENEDGESPRRSRRLRDVRDRTKSDDDESDSETDDDTKSETNKRKRKRTKTTNSSKSPPRKKQRKTKKETNWSFPSFAQDKVLLRKIGLNPFNRNKQKKWEGKTYKYNRNKRYILLEILGHKLSMDLDIVLKDFEDEKMWYKSINYAPIQGLLRKKRLKRRREQEEDEDEEEEGSLGNEQERNYEQDEEEKKSGKMPQFVFGRLLFECKFEGWPDNVWQCWDIICGTEVFESYAIGMEWDKDNELQATIAEHSDEDVDDIIMNMAVYGNPTTRKALKVLLGKELNVW